MALKQTEDQVKQMRDDSSTGSQSKPTSVRDKIANRASKVTGKSSKEKIPSMLLSDQDIKAALGLVDESWGRQMYRLQQYLQRNNDIPQGVPTTMDVDDEEFPTMEKEIRLGAEVAYDESESVTPLEKDLEMSFSENREAFDRPVRPRAQTDLASFHAGG